MSRPRSPRRATAPSASADQREYAVRLLARRDHARAELRRKMMRRFGVDADPEPVLDWCTEHGFLDDQRFAGFFVRARIERGQGALRIRAELQQRGVAVDLADAALEESDCDWFALAETVYRRRFRTAPTDVREKAKRLRFLQSRGFNAEQCYHALSHAGADTPS